MNYLTTIPHPWDKDELLTKAYRLGWSNGHGVACHNVPTLGDKIDRSVDYVGCGDFVTAENIREYHELLTHAGADNSRQYSPFEFTAHWINSGGDDETLSDDDRSTYATDMWEAFEAGESAAIEHDVASYTNEDYGVGDEE